MATRHGRIALVLAVLASTVFATGAGAQGPGVTDKEILLCSYQPMTGKESTYFRMGKGADIWYKHVNEQGGVNGRKINFKMVDDQYNPSRTTVVVKEFVERDKCFAIANPLGSAPTAAVIDYITENKVPLIGAGTGAAKNLEYPSRYVFPLYPSYHTSCGSPRSSSAARLSPCSTRTTPRARRTSPASSRSWTSTG
jgi:ABC-type branched-subunit amino acid transport system substrate-binding protein